MRENKFIGRDIFNKCMVYPNHEIEWLYQDEYWGDEVEIINKLFHTGNYKWMQYAWREDNNWKEIYEWYLIQYSWNSRVWEVYFDEDRLQYRIRCTGKDWFVSSYSMEWLDCFIVGNIYENPDLINN